MLKNTGFFKMFFLNLLKSFNQFSKKLISDSIIKEFGNLIFLIIENINNRSEYNTKNNITDNKKDMQFLEMD